MPANNFVKIFGRKTCQLKKRILERKVAQNPVFVQWFIGFMSSKQTYEVFKTVHFHP